MAVSSRPETPPVHITVLQPDPISPLQRLGPWLERAGAELDVVDLTQAPQRIDDTTSALVSSAVAPTLWTRRPHFGCLPSRYPSRCSFV